MILPVRMPAHLELRPDIEKWQVVKDDLANMIQHWAGVEGEVTRLESGIEEPLGYYRIGSRDNKFFFAKILKEEAIESQLQSNKMARWLAEKEISVNCMLPGYPKLGADRIGVLVYPYLTGNYVSTNNTDLSMLGSAIAKLHAILRECPWVEQIQYQGLQRHTNLLNLLKKIKHGAQLRQYFPSDIWALLHEHVEIDLLDVLIIEPQVVHGDLNFGNVVIQSGTNKITFLDFEDTWTSWFSPIMEISFAIERFALQSEDPSSEDFARELYLSYIRKGGVSFCYQSQLADTLRALSVRALLLLMLVTQNNSWRVPESEWEKFKKLYENALLRKSLLEKIGFG